MPRKSAPARHLFLKLAPSVHPHKPPFSTTVPFPHSPGPKSPVPHPFAFFPAKGWEATDSPVVPFPHSPGPKSPVPHPFAFFPAKGWETKNSTSGAFSSTNHTSPQ